MSKKIPQNIEVDEDGKARISTATFDALFRSILKALPSVTLNADPAKFRTNPVTPGVGPLVIPAETWTKRWQTSGEAAADDWYEHALTPSGDPVALALAANDKRKDRLEKAEKAEKWVKKMKKLKAADVFDGIQAVEAAGYKRKITASAGKAGRRFAELQPKVLALKQAIQKLSDKTDDDREKRMLAARKGMIAIGESA